MASKASDARKAARQSSWRSAQDRRQLNAVAQREREIVNRAVALLNPSQVRDIRDGKAVNVAPAVVAHVKAYGGLTAWQHACSVRAEGRSKKKSGQSSST